MPVRWCSSASSFVDGKSRYLPIAALLAAPALIALGTATMSHADTAATHNGPAGELVPCQDDRMDAATLRELQAPLKQLYRDDPLKARTPLEAEASFETKAVTATVQTWADPIRAGLHPATGGDGSDACSGDMLLQALLACAGVTMRSVATAMGIDVAGAELRATGMFDARGTLGISRDVPIGVQEFSIVAELQTDADDATLAKLAELTERYCVVGQSLAQVPSIAIRRRTAP